MAAITDVWQACFPAALPLADPPDREVGWVRVLKPRVPAFDALEASDLAILPLASLRELAGVPVEAASVVEALADAGGAGIVVTGAVAEEPLARAALDRAAALGLGAFLLRDADVTALERAVIGFLVNERAELERQASLLEAQLERLALDGRDLEAHAAAIARFLGRAVAIERPRGRPLAVHAPVDVPAAAAAAAAYLGHPRRAALRVRLPDPTSTGALVLLGPHAPSELERVVADRVAGLLALELQRGAAGRDADAGAARRSLPADGPPWVSLVARQISLEQPTTLEEREQVRAEIQGLAPARRLGVRGDAASLDLRLVAAADATDPQGTSIAERVAALIGRPIAVSRPFLEPEQRALAEAEARQALEALEVLRPDELAANGTAGALGGTMVARADRLPAYRLLGAVHDIPDGQRQARVLLGPLLEGRAARVVERLTTLRAVLDGPGLTDAAAALGVHRNTLTYRIARIEDMTGWNLEDPALRFALGMAVRIVQSAQSGDHLATALSPVREGPPP